MSAQCSCSARVCFCRLAWPDTSGFPRTITALRACTQVDILGSDLEAWAFLGTQLSDALISTRNRAAFIAESGGYGRVTCASERWRPTQKRVNFRFGVDEAVMLFRSHSQAQLGLPDALGCCSGDGQIIHLIQVRTRSDLSIINALELSSPTPEQPCLDVPLSDDIIPFGPIMRARFVGSGRYGNASVRFAFRSWPYSAKMSGPCRAQSGVAHFNIYFAKLFDLFERPSTFFGARRA